MTTKSIRKPKSRKLSIKQRMEGGGLVILLEDLENRISKGVIDEITDLWHEGYNLIQISEAFHFDPDQTFLILLHQARQGKITRSFAYKKDIGGNNDGANDDI